ncbi:FxSxx-COOH system tetratricopeptide repeat protein [Streptomyces sp. NPDC057718]|uniref:FxSxx-COOH system tetratricopeptide repeat protein n=1 Tax=Streptomyces sp. NPDC057718 TaxID=3346225 RepID=UPI00369D693A
MELPSAPQKWFASRLQRLRVSSGSPTQAQLLAHDKTKVLTRSSLSDLLTGKFTKPPPWERVAAYVGACVRAADTGRIALALEEELSRLRADHATLTDLLETADPKPRAPAPHCLDSSTSRLPPRNPHFTGRNALLRELRRRLTSGRGAVVQAVHGLGGAGKTQLAVEYAYRYRSQYRFVAFVDAEHPNLVLPQFASLAQELGLAEVPFEQVVPRVYDALRGHSPWLVILDNGDRAGPLVNVLPSGDAEGSGHVVVTTRSRGWSSRAGVVDLDVFTRRESMELLDRRVDGITPAVADRIAEHLGDLPLALEQAAGYMDYNHTPPEDYLALLASRLEDMIALGELADRPTVVVATLWQLSVRRLETERPQAKQLLELCSLLAPEPIPLDLFSGSADIWGATVADPVAWDTTVGALAGLGLARRDLSCLVLHRLVQAAIRSSMPDVVRSETRARLCRALLRAVPHDIHGVPDARSRWQILLPHVVMLTRDEPPSECAAETALLLRLAAVYLLSIGDHEVALPLCERALAIDESLEDRDVEIGFDLITLAQIHRERGTVMLARPPAERALSLHQSCLPSGSTAIATDLATLARILCELGDHEAAVPLAERALRIDEAAYGQDDPYVSFDLIALATVYLDINDPSAAAPLIYRALRIREARYAPDHLYIGYALLLKARVMYALGDPSGAGLAYRGALILNTQLGRAHAKTENAFTLAAGLLERCGHDERQSGELGRSR